MSSEAAGLASPSFSVSPASSFSSRGRGDGDTVGVADRLAGFGAVLGGGLSSSCRDDRTSHTVLAVCVLHVCVVHVCVVHVCVVHVCVVHVCVVHVCGACVYACMCMLACVCGACVCGACVYWLCVCLHDIVCVVCVYTYLQV